MNTSSYLDSQLYQSSVQSCRRSTNLNIGAMSFTLNFVSAMYPISSIKAMPWDALSKISFSSSSVFLLLALYNLNRQLASYLASWATRSLWLSCVINIWSSSFNAHCLTMCVMRGVIASCRGVASVSTSPQKKQLFPVGGNSACRSLHGSPPDASLHVVGRTVISALSRRLAEYFKRHDECHWAWLRAKVLPMPSPSSSLSMSIGNGRLPNWRKLFKLWSRVPYPAPMYVRFELAWQFRGLLEGSWHNAQRKTRVNRVTCGCRIWWC